jgi:tRNA A-37 threonylcarbamoyl transferase component Bud32
VSVWTWLKAAFHAPPPPTLPARTLRAPSVDEIFLRRVLSAKNSESGSSPADISQTVGEDVFLAVDRLVESGREETALHMLRQLDESFPQDARLLVRLTELLCERLQYDAAVPLLERLALLPEHANRAHLLLGEAAEQRGDTATALRHFEIVLSIDIDHPQARRRALPLRRRGRPTPSSHTTWSGLPEGGTPLGRYQLVRELGRGASGSVYLALDQFLEREVALKLLHPKDRAGAQAEARTHAWREARMVAAIRHPGVVAIFEFDEERQIYVMELCRGGALAARLARGPYPPAAALRRAMELVATIEAVHQRGVVHGDLKPANLLFREEGEEAALVLGDFGVAHVCDDPQLPVEQRAGRGTLAYMAPEQRRGELEPASDLYAVGVILVELLAGRPALASWLEDRAGLFTGRAQWEGRFPDHVERALGGKRAVITSLARALMATSSAERPLLNEVLAILEESIRSF